MTDEELVLVAKVELFHDADHVDACAIGEALKDRGYKVDFLVDPEDEEPDYYIERAGGFE